MEFPGVGQYPKGWYGAGPPFELAELALELTLDANGLRPSLGRPAGGVRTLLTTAGVGCVALVDA